MSEEIVARKTSIIMHHSLTRDGQVVDFAAMRNYHMSYRIDGKTVSKLEYDHRREINDGRLFEEPWSDIGYHVVIERVGLNVEAIFGRMPNTQGAHCRELRMNMVGIGICCVGNFDESAPPDDLWKKALQVVRYFSQTLAIPKDRVLGHGEAQMLDPAVRRAIKSCPGKYFDMVKFRGSLGQV